jgi:hypothetical protein
LEPQQLQIFLNQIKTTKDNKALSIQTLLSPANIQKLPTSGSFALLVVVSLLSSWGVVVVVIDGWFFSVDNNPFSAMILVEPWTSITPCSKKACKTNATCKKRTDMGTGLRLGNDYCVRTRN